MRFVETLSSVDVSLWNGANGPDVEEVESLSPSVSLILAVSFAGVIVAGVIVGSVIFFRRRRSQQPTTNDPTPEDLIQE
jgi:heme/copper-type cytochrome/quinol oxidase subunit 2